LISSSRSSSGINEGDLFATGGSIGGGCEPLTGPEDNFTEGPGRAGALCAGGGAIRSLLDEGVAPGEFSEGGGGSKVGGGSEEGGGKFIGGGSSCLGGGTKLLLMIGGGRLFPDFAGGGRSSLAGAILVGGLDLGVFSGGAELVSEFVNGFAVTGVAWPLCFAFSALTLS